MTTNANNFRPRLATASSEQYLEASIRTATPARLRLMLTERAVAVADTLAKTWQKGEQLNANEHSLKLLELINELLSGVAGSGNEREQQLCRQVADLYVFLAQHLVRAESNSDVDAINEIRLVLETEAETWRAVCAREMPVAGKTPLAGTTSPAGGLNFSA